MIRRLEIAARLQVTPLPAVDAELCTENLPGRLAQSWISAALDRTALPAEIRECLLAHATAFAANPDIAAYFNDLSRTLFQEKLQPSYDATLLPQRIAAMSESEEYAFFALLALSGFESARQAFAYAALLPESLTGAFADTEIWIRHFWRNRQICGFPGRIFGWERGILNGTPLTIGRLQFRLQPFEMRVQCFRLRSTGEVVAFAGSGVRCNRAGYLDGVNGDYDPVAWETQFAATAAGITGNPILPTGKVLREYRTIATNDAIPVFRQGDLTLDTHIPEGDSLTLDDCRKAMVRALAFFRDRYPNKTIRAFSCLSWMLDPQYEFLLKPNSRILGFMHQYYLFPIEESGDDALWRIFGEDGLKDGIAHAPRHTSMQRKVAEFIERGGKLRSGGGFFLCDDLERYGEEPYRRTGSR